MKISIFKTETIFEKIAFFQTLFSHQLLITKLKILTSLAYLQQVIKLVASSASSLVGNLNYANELIATSLLAQQQLATSIIKNQAFKRNDNFKSKRRTCYCTFVGSLFNIFFVMLIRKSYARTPHHHSSHSCTTRSHVRAHTYTLQNYCASSLLRSLRQLGITYADTLPQTNSFENIDSW